MLLLDFRIFAFLFLATLLPVSGQVKIIDEFTMDHSVSKLAMSIDDGVVSTIQSFQQEMDTSSCKVIKFNEDLDVVAEIDFLFKEFPFGLIHNIDQHSNKEEYLLLMSCTDSRHPDDRFNRKLQLVILNKELTEYSTIEIMDWDNYFEVFNPTMIRLSDSRVRYYFSLKDVNNNFGYELNYFDFDLITHEIYNQSISEINPQWIYRDSKLLDSLVYFSSGTGFHHRSLDESSFQNYQLSWPKSGVYIHSISDIHFEILSNRKVVLSGFYNYQFAEINSNHAISVFHLDSLATMYNQDPPDMLYTFDEELTNRAFTRSITKIPNTDEVWVFGGNINLLDIFLPLPDRETTLYLTKLDSEGEFEFTKKVEMDGYAYPSYCTSDDYGNVYASGFIVKVNEDEYLKGFIVKVNRNGELSEIIETPTDNNLSFYPNPVSEKIRIDGVSNGNYKIVTMQGRVIISGAFDNSEISFSDLPPAPYVLVIEHNGQLSLQKVIKQ